MAWTGDIIRQVVGAAPSDTGCTVYLECGHEIPLIGVEPWTVIVRLRNMVCPTCSHMHWERIKKIQDSISFESVLTKIKTLKDTE